MGLNNNHQQIQKDFKVYIVESPSSINILNDEKEGENLQGSLKLESIKSNYYLAIDKTAFNTAFGKIEIDANENKEKPIIHISAHGNEDGIGLCDGTVISWMELREYLQPINNYLLRNFNHGLILCLSSCNGLSGCRMAMFDDNYPFSFIVGCKSEVLWTDTNIGFMTFYHLYKKGISLPDCIKAMKVASGDESFDYMDSEIARQAYLSVTSKPKTE